MRAAERNRAYLVLSERFATAAKLSAAREMLFWDSQTYMPAGGAWARGEQVAAIYSACADLIAAPDAGDLFAAAEEAADTLGDVERSNLAEMRRMWRHSVSAPKALLMERARFSSALHADWRAAKSSNQFALFAGGFARLMSIHREIAEATGEALGLSAYDALMDATDPGLTAAVIDPMFDDLEASLPALLGEVLERQASWPKPRPFSGDFSIERQRALSQTLLSAVGHSPAQVRLDASPQAYTIGQSPSDVRIMMRFDADNFLYSVRATLHEAGHVLYELGLPRELAFTPVGAPRGATTHEGQALMLDMQAGRSREFLTWLAPVLAKTFGGEPESWTPANLLNHYRRVGQGFIRTTADEISYPLHVILRHRIERALLSGDLSVTDLPGAWSDLSQRLFGRRPPDDARGCLQDVHWANGMFGYFPSYALGVAFAAQLYEAATSENPQIQSNLAHGDFSSHRDWVHPRIHDRASKVPFAKLVEESTGASLSTAALKRHLRNRYLEEVMP